MTKTIAFIGIDGVGKSTIVRGMNRELQQRGYNCASCYMGRGKYRLQVLNLLESLYSHYRTSENEATDRNDSRASEVTSPHVSNPIYLLVYFFDLWFRFLESKYLSNNEVVLMDRYFYDGLILSGKTDSWLIYLIPTPNKSYHLVAPPNVIRERKQQATFEEIQMFQENASHLYEEFDIEEVNNTKKKEVVINDLANEIERIL